MLATVVAASALLVSFQGISALMRNHRELRYLVTPGNYLVSLVQVAAEAQAAAEDLFARRRALVGRTPSPATDLGKAIT